MSGYTMTQEEVLYSGPPSNYPSAGASGTSEVLAMVGASGDYSQPLLPGGFWQQGRQNQVARFTFGMVVNGQGSATTLIVKLGLNTTQNTITSGAVLLTYPAVTITSYASGTVYGSGIIQCRGTGYGTSSVSTSLITCGELSGTGNALSVTAAAGPTTLLTTDFSVNQWLYLSVTFSTNSASNNATLEQFVLEGMN